MTDIAPGQELTLGIDSLASGGDGVGRTPSGLVVFVPGAAPGDTVRTRITSREPNRAVGEVLEVTIPSPSRTEPECPHFGECGGCRWQHVAHERQLEEKRRVVADALERIGGLEEPPVEPPVGSRPYGYRNRIELRVEDTGDGPRLGYTGLDGVTFVGVRRCHLLPEHVRDAPARLEGALRYLAGASGLPLERVAVRVAAHTRDVQVDLWGPPAEFPRAPAARVLSDAVGARGVTRCLVREGEGRRVRRVEVLSGPGFLKERLAGHTFRVSPPSFFQVNTKTAEELVAHVVQASGAAADVHVLDAYAGVGTITVPLADTGARLTAAESSRYALADLGRNLAAAQATAEVLRGPFERTVAQARRVDVVVVDPPRAGLAREVPAAIASSGAQRLVYVSCDPATAARDIARLTSLGFSLRRSTPFDLFPQTPHVEMIAVLVR